METLKTIGNPNFSVIVPGPCNARCSFCFWQRDDDEIEHAEFCQALMHTVKTLPSQFRQVSITGGEPTLSPRLLLDIITILGESKRFDKIVLSTNGAQLAYLFASAHFWHVTNVNISRHAISDIANSHVFGVSGDKLLGLNLIEALCRSLNRGGVEACVNAVLTPALGNVHGFLRHMRSAGFTEACFRKPHAVGSDLSMTSEEASIAMEYQRVQHSECPVCRSDLYIVNGMKTWWTASLPEPSDLMVDEVYELVMHPDGKVYADWSKNIEVEL